MIICKNCRHENITGTLFCTECGMQLDESGVITTKTFPGEKAAELQKTPPVVETPSSPKDSWLSLHLLDSGKIIALPMRNEFTMGRLSEGQPIMPDIDLMPYDAYAAGVSRLHAVIKREEGRVIIMDLGSSNGSYLNGRRLNPHTEENLKHGDVIALGKMKIQVLLRIV